MHPNHLKEQSYRAATGSGLVAKILPDRILITKPREEYKVTERSLQNLQVRKHDVALSDCAKRNIKQSVMSMYALSMPRVAKISTSKFIRTFRCSFVTLKLPASQFHSDVEIKAVLNYFLNNLRNSWKLDNYLWVAELQKNENIHFHLVIDKYVPWQVLTRYWNKAIKSLGYIERYAEKFREMSQFEYVGFRIAQDKKYGNPIRISAYQSAYEAGVKEDWQNPNSVDVKSVKGRRVAYYVSKYIAKGDKTNVDSERAEEFGKMWSRSQSLSTLEYRRQYTLSLMSEIVEAVKKAPTTRDFSFDYCRILYFKLDALPWRIRNLITAELVDNATQYNYPFSVN